MKNLETHVRSNQFNYFISRGPPLTERLEKKIRKIRVNTHRHPQLSNIKKKKSDKSKNKDFSKHFQKKKRETVILRKIFLFVAVPINLTVGIPKDAPPK